MGAKRIWLNATFEQRGHHSPGPTPPKFKLLYLSSSFSSEAVGQIRCNRNSKSLVLIGFHHQDDPKHHRNQPHGVEQQPAEREKSQAARPKARYENRR